MIIQDLPTRLAQSAQRGVFDRRIYLTSLQDAALLRQANKSQRRQDFIQGRKKKKQITFTPLYGKVRYRSNRLLEAPKLFGSRFGTGWGSPTSKGTYKIGRAKNVGIFNGNIQAGITESPELAWTSSGYFPTENQQAPISQKALRKTIKRRREKNNFYGLRTGINPLGGYEQK